MSLSTLLERHRLVVVVGTGGVGKTTLAAALGLMGATQGRRAMVLTIDPARALGRALGLAGLDSGARTIGESLFHEAGLTPLGSLDAAMLDQKTAWDALIARHVPASPVRQSIFDNPFYQELSRRFAGATEYAALEELCRLSDSGRYDLMVLDTPPAAHALDFVRAPSRIDRLLDPEISRWLTRPYLRAGAAAGSTLKFLLRRLARATGSKTLEDISSFFSSFDGVLDGLRRRSRAARALLYGPDAAFVLVAGPEEYVLGATEALGVQMNALGIPLKAVVQNRVHALPGGLDARYESETNALLSAFESTGVSTACARWLRKSHEEALAMARAEYRCWTEFQKTLPPDVERVRIAELAHDVHSLRDVAALAAELCVDPAPRSLCGAFGT